MKINFSAPILNFDGEAVMETDEKGKPLEGKPLTLSTISVNALVMPLPDGRGQQEHLDGAAKVRHACLAETIFKSTAPIDLKVEDIALIKERIGRGYGPLVVMRCWALLESGADA